MSHWQSYSTQVNCFFCDSTFFIYCVDIEGRLMSCINGEENDGFLSYENEPLRIKSYVQHWCSIRIPKQTIKVKVCPVYRCFMDIIFFPLPEPGKTIQRSQVLPPSNNFFFRLDVVDIDGFPYIDFFTFYEDQLSFTD